MKISQKVHNLPCQKWQPKNSSVIQYIFQEKIVVCPEKTKKFTPKVLPYGVNLWQRKLVSDSGNTFDIVGIAWVYL